MCPFSSAYRDSSDFSTPVGSQYLSDHNIDTVGVGSTTLDSILPTSQYTGHTLSSLELWFKSGYAYSKFKKTSDYYALSSGGIRKSGGHPFLLIRNIPGVCSPYCQKMNCFSEAGTPKTNANSNFSWWSTLITGYLKLALKADPNIDTVHIWNEPDTVSDYY